MCLVEKGNPDAALTQGRSLTVNTANTHARAHTHAHKIHIETLDTVKTIQHAIVPVALSVCLCMCGGGVEGLPTHPNVVL